jgi:hypothetical protein
MALATETKTINGEEVKAEVGSYVVLDGKNFGVKLLTGEDYVDSGFSGCQFRWPNPIREWEKSRAFACNVKVTGRTFQYRNGGRWVRVEVEWVGDCEPSTFAKGYMSV